MFGLSTSKVKKKPIVFLGYSENSNKNTRLPCAEETDNIPVCTLGNHYHHNKNMDMDAREIAQHWLDALTFSVATWNLDAHMALVSAQVKVKGLPGIEVVDYDGWKERRQNEFSKKLLRSLSYRLHTIASQGEDRLLFTVVETMKSNQGQTITVDKAINLRREEDGRWRVVQERIDRIELK